VVGCCEHGNTLSIDAEFFAYLSDLVSQGLHSMESFNDSIPSHYTHARTHTHAHFILFYFTLHPFQI
jgi:hypothetical protein